MIFDAARTPILITSRDRLTPLRALVSWLEKAGHQRIVFVDNDSSFGPLLEYYEQTPHQVLRLGANLGHLSVWEADVLATIGHKGMFVVTDPDVVPDEACPLDAVEHFAQLLLRHGDVDKAGFGLRIDDLPATYAFRSEVIEWESQFWDAEVEPGVFRADIDTTFALYRPSTSQGAVRALRSGPPYVARHLGWYSDSRHLSDEEHYYRTHARAGVSNWDADEIPEELRDALVHRRAQKAAGPPESEDSNLGRPGTEPDVVAALQETLTNLESELGHEQEAHRAAVAELEAVRDTRSYRVLAPLRRLHAAARGRERTPKEAP